MVVTLLRTLVVFITLIAVMRLMGKRQIGEMQPFEFVITLIIADIACIPMTDVSIPLVYGIVSIIGLFLLHRLMFLLELGGNFTKRIVSGKPSIVINKDGVDLKELKKNDLGVEDLIEAMRSQGYFSLSDLDYAIFETNGKLSALESPDKKAGGSIPLLVIGDGKLQKSNLKRIKTTEEELNGILSENKTTIKNTEVFTVDGDGNAYLKSKGKKFSTFTLRFKEGVKW